MTDATQAISTNGAGQQQPLAQGTAAHAPVPLSVLENLAARFRPGGLCLVILRADGSGFYQDPAANLFFQRYALPLVQYPEAESGLSAKVAALTSKSTVEIWNVLPGVVLAAFPYVEKRQLLGVMLLAGKSNSFRLGEDVL